MFLFSTTAYQGFAKRLAKQAGLKLKRVEISKFADGELYVRVRERVKGQGVYVLATTAPPSDNLLELCLLTNALKTAGARHITAVIPYFGYARADRVVKPGEAVNAKLVIDLLQCAGIDKFITVNLHSERARQFFKTPLVDLDASKVLLPAIEKLHLENLVVVAPDNGALPMAKFWARGLKCPVAWMEKTRPKPNIAAIHALHGEVRGKTAILVDDMIDTGGTIVQAAGILKKAGARKIMAAVVHGVFSGSALKCLQKSAIEKVFVTDTVPEVYNRTSDKLIVVSVAPMVASALKYVLQKHVA